MMRKFVHRLSSSIYKLFRKHAIPLPRETFQNVRIRSAAKSEWGEAKVALLQEISASNNSSVSRLFNRKLLERIEELEKTIPVPVIAELAAGNAGGQPGPNRKYWSNKIGAIRKPPLPKTTV